MQYEACDYILSLGKNAAMHKMTLERNLPKPDMRSYSFPCLHLLLEEEVSELKTEIIKTITGNPLTQELLQAIQDEAGDVIAFASGVAAKAQQEAGKLYDPQPSLRDYCDMAGSLVEGPKADLG
jgi:hypothetical protein